MFRVESAECEITWQSGKFRVQLRKEKAYTHHDPQMRNAQVARNSAEFLLFIETPNWFALVHDLVADYLLHWFSRIAITGLQCIITRFAVAMPVQFLPSCKYNDVSW